MSLTKCREQGEAAWVNLQPAMCVLYQIALRPWGEALVTPLLLPFAAVSTLTQPGRGAGALPSPSVHPDEDI